MKDFYWDTLPREISPHLFEPIKQIVVALEEAKKKKKLITVHVGYKGIDLTFKHIELGRKYTNEHLRIHWSLVQHASISDNVIHIDNLVIKIL